MDTRGFFAGVQGGGGGRYIFFLGGGVVTTNLMRLFSLTVEVFLLTVCLFTYSGGTVSKKYQI